MLGVGLEDIWGGAPKMYKQLRGDYQKYQRKVGGAPKIMYNINHKTSVIIVHCNINVNAI
jgi:hypothetical protein